MGVLLRLACVLVLAAGLAFDVPYARAVAELRELYPQGHGVPGGDGKPIPLQAVKDQPQQRKADRLVVERLTGADVHAVLSFGITHAEPSLARRYVIHLESWGLKFSWKRQADITLHRLSESRTAVTVRCNYLWPGIFGFGYSRHRDRDYERERLAEILARLERQ